MEQTDTQKNWNDFWENERKKKEKNKKQKSGCQIALFTLLIAALIIIIRNGDYIGNFIIDTIDNKDLLSINKNIEFTNTVFIPEEIINNNSSLTHEKYVDYNSALYIDGELVIRDKIIANFNKMLNNLKNGNNIDIIELHDFTTL